MTMLNQHSSTLINPQQPGAGTSMPTASARPIMQLEDVSVFYGKYEAVRGT